MKDLKWEDNMAQFHASNFIFDGTPSHLFDLKIINFTGGEVFSGKGSSNVNIYTQRTFRKSAPYYLGRSEEPVLEFELTFGRHTEVSAKERSIISAWLFGRAGYKKLEILQDDLQGAWFNCFLTEPTSIYIGNMNYAFTCKVICDSPYAYSPQKMLTYSWQSLGSTYETLNFEIYNNSSEDNYLYPNLEFTFKSSGSNMQITNHTDGSRVFSFYDVTEAPIIDIEDDYLTITVNNDLQMIETSSNELVLDYFNKNWFRLLPGNNVLTMYGQITLMNIIYNERLKIGG